MRGAEGTMLLLVSDWTNTKTNTNTNTKTKTEGTMLLLVSKKKLTKEALQKLRGAEGCLL